MPALLERPKMTRAMYEALKRHIIREREKKKQEQEQDAMMERLKKERELKKKKEEQDHLTLEETREQINQLGKKLEHLKAQKHDLFSQLKKVLHQDEKRKAQQKEESELTLPQSTYHPPQLATAPQPMMMHGRPALYKPTATTHILTGIKRQRSPTPPPSSTSSSYSGYGHSEAKYPHTSESKYSHADVKFSSHAESKFGHADPKYLASFAGGKPPAHLYTAQHAQPADFKPSAYQQATTSQLYANPSFQQQQAAAAVATSYPSSQAGGSKYPGPPGQSAFTSYQGHYAQAHPQKALPEQFPAAYQIQRMQQPAARAGYHAGLQLQQTLDHSVQKPAGFDEKYKMGQSQIRGLVASPQQPAMMTQAIQLQKQQQQQQAKGSGAFVPGYPPRTQGAPPGANFPTSTSSTYSGNPNTGQGRPGYGSQPHGRYYQ